MHSPLSRFPPLRPCRDSMRERSKLLLQQSHLPPSSSEPALLDDQTGALSGMLGELELNESAPEQVRPDGSNPMQVGLPYQKPVVGSDMGTPV